MVNCDAVAVSEWLITGRGHYGGRVGGGEGLLRDLYIILDVRSKVRALRASLSVPVCPVRGRVEDLAGRALRWVRTR